MRAFAAFIAVLALATAAEAKAAPLRIGVVGGDLGDAAYQKLLATRLGVAVEAKPLADRTAAASALASGQVDMAVLDGAAYGPVRGKVRAVLTLRPQGDLNRIPVVVAVRADAAAKDLSTLKGRSAVFGGLAPAALATPHKALADAGAGPGFFQETTAASADAAAAALRARKADVLVLNAGAWQRLCRGDSPKADACKDLKVVWRGRPRARLAIAVRRDMPAETRFRLIGVHVAMHVEDKAAFAGSSVWTPRAAEFEPTEAEALAPSS